MWQPGLLFRMPGFNTDQNGGGSGNGGQVQQNGGQGQQGQQGQQQDGGQGQGQPGLLNDPNFGGEPNPPIGPGQQPGQQQGQQQGQQGSQPVTLEQMQQLVQQSQQANTSEIDRRINQLMGTLQQRGVIQPQGQQQQGQGQQQQQQQPVQQQQSNAGPAAADLRESRYSYRSYVNDSIRFLSAEERALADDMAQVALAERLEQGDDPDQAGRTVAASVAERTKQLRSVYEKQLTAEMIRKGILPQNYGQGQGQPNWQQHSQSGGQGGYDKGAAIAQQMFADRLPQKTQ